MPFEQPPTTPRRIAVIGGGISGMGAAHYLADAHRVTLFEAEPRLGGHARTVLAGKHGDQPVDMGFIVFNNANYPLLTRLFDELDVPVTESRMSFGVSIDGGRFEYGLSSLGSVFAQRRNLADPRYWRLIHDVLRFNARGYDTAQEAGLTVGGLLDRLRSGRWFRDYYLLPFSGAIWSVPKAQILEFPARAMLEFFRNHHLLGITGQHQWYTVAGGSIAYVRRLEAALGGQGVDIRKCCAVRSVRRDAGGVEVAVPGGPPERFDEVVFATHSDQAMRLLSDPTAEERATVGRIGYQPNRVVLHSDTGVMPRRRLAWSSWNYTEDPGGPQGRIGVSYWMNSLQPIPEDDPLFVTLNDARPIREELIHEETTFAHPVYDTAALEAQARLPELQGANGTWFCGAWVKNGFHEDGLSSAHDVARTILARDAGIAAA
ncbi:NAD(P)/FAD-dependent oxidoreductase [Rhodosalinus sp. FB01]|uniref:NAD(P)/FAD-dependent oxidoreductase n=1 Tax=Rhodosalinus sp. FB01 TaxID=3239194 RepID=UPI0035238582